MSALSEYFLAARSLLEHLSDGFPDHQLRLAVHGEHHDVGAGKGDGGLAAQSGKGRMALDLAENVSYQLMRELQCGSGIAPLDCVLFYASGNHVRIVRPTSLSNSSGRLFHTTVAPIEAVMVFSASR